jgi:hypothetical protein
MAKKVPPFRGIRPRRNIELLRREVGELYVKSFPCVTDLGRLSMASLFCCPTRITQGT